MLRGAKVFEYLQALVKASAATHEQPPTLNPSRNHRAFGFHPCDDSGVPWQWLRRRQRAGRRSRVSGV